MDHDPAQAGGFRRAFRGFEIDARGAHGRARRRAAARRAGHRAPPRQDRGGPRQRPARPVLARSTARSRPSCGASSPPAARAAAQMTRGRVEAHGDADLARALEGTPRARLPLRRAHHRLRVHAGDGARERPSRGLRRERAHRADAPRALARCRASRGERPRSGGVLLGAPTEAPMTTRLGLQIPNFSFPGVPDLALFEQVAAIAAQAEDGRLRHRVRDGPLLPAADARPAGPGDARGVHAARRARGAHAPRAARDARHGQHATGTRPCSRRSSRRSTSSRAAARMLGIGAGWFEPEHVGYGFDFPPIRERLDRLDEALAIIRADAPRRAADLRGALLPRARGAELAGAGSARRSADPDRRHRREAHAAARGEVCGREQPDLRARGDPAQARGARATLRGGRPRPAHDRQDLARLVDRRADERAGRSCAQRLLRARGMDWDSLPEPMRDIIEPRARDRRSRHGGRARAARDLERRARRHRREPARQRHEPEAVELAAATLRKALG